MTDTLQDLFEHELRDIYDAEHKILRALETMAKKTPDEALSRGFDQHRDTTQEQINRLETIFGELDKKPRREPCKGINGLIEEFSEFVKEEEPSDEVLNTFAIAAALKVEHYEIVAYESLLRLAVAIGLRSAPEQLQQTLTEERHTAQELDERADGLLGRLPDTGLTDVASEETIVLPETEEVGPR